MKPLFIPITKVDEEKRLVYGTLCAETPDKTGEILDYESAKPAFKLWSEDTLKRSKGKSKGNVRAMHSSIAAGILTDLTFNDASKSIEGCAKVVDDAEWEKVKTGTYTGFSIGGGYSRRWPDVGNPDLMRYTPTLSEVSLVDNPCVPSATFNVIKKDGTHEMRKFHLNSTAKEAETMTKNTETNVAADIELEQVWRKKGDNSIIAADKEIVRKAFVKKTAEEMAKSAMDGIAALSAKLGKATDEDEDKDATKNEKTEGAEKGDALEAPVGEHVGTANESSNTEKPGDASAAMKSVTGESPDGTKPGLAGESSNTSKPGDASAAMKGEKEETLAGEPVSTAQSTNTVTKKDYSDKERGEMAEEGHAMPDGSFPIKDKNDLGNAVEAFGRAKNKAKVKEHIKSRAKDLGAEDKLPDHWKKTAKEFAAGEMRKGLCEAAETAHILNALSNMHDRIELEQAMEHDYDSDQAEKLKAWISQGVEFLKDQISEETAELFEDDDKTSVLEMAVSVPMPVGKADAAIVMAKYIAGLKPFTKDELKKSANQALAKRMVKTLDVLEKAGKTHSKETLAKLQAVHDGLHECMKSMNSVRGKVVDMGADGTAAQQELGMDHGEGANKATLAELRKVTSSLQDAQVREETFVTMFGDMGKSLETLSKRVDDVLKLPAPAKGVLRGARPLGKGEDEGNLSKASPAQAEADLMQSMEKMSPQERSMFLVKAARLNPIKD